MRAIILAGGRGARLAPYTTVIPKPLLPVGEKPILEIICRQLAQAGFSAATLSLGYMSDYFKTFLAQQRALRGSSPSTLLKKLNLPARPAHWRASRIWRAIFW